MNVMIMVLMGRCKRSPSIKENEYKFRNIETKMLLEGTLGQKK